MIKKSIKKYFSVKNWRYMKIGLTVAVMVAVFVLVSYSFYQVFTTIGVSHESSLPQIKEFTEHRLVAIPAKGIFGGVLAGFAYYFAFPLWLLRVFFIVAICWSDDLSDIFILGYILCYIFLPVIDFIPADFIAKTGG